jgi:hypothetical protein
MVASSVMATAGTRQKYGACWEAVFGLCGNRQSRNETDRQLDLCTVFHSCASQVAAIVHHPDVAAST